MTVTLDKLATKRVPASAKSGFSVRCSDSKQHGLDAIVRIVVDGAADCVATERTSES